LGWVEILRREARFLDLGSTKSNQHIAELMEKITEIFFDDNYGVFLLYRGEQRAVGEIMIAPRTGDNSSDLECIGYATFVQKLREPDFMYWFQGLHEDMTNVIHNPDVNTERIVLLQHALIDLIDFLDPNCVRIPKTKRVKVKSDENFNKIKAYQSLCQVSDGMSTLGEDRDE
jgi:hypothetical protein